MQRTATYIMLSLLFCVATQPANSRPENDGSNALPPFGHTFFCLRYPRDCAKASRTLALPTSAADRWREINLVNSSVNTAITPRADPDPIGSHWLIAPIAGDCNDYAVTKRHLLLRAGWPSSSLLLAEVTLVSTGEHHLVLIVKTPEADWVLDNLKPEIVRLAATRNEYAWVRIESADNPRFWTNSFAGLS
jgi:predicted transglutaminase-like cysteine proteinase